MPDKQHNYRMVITSSHSSHTLSRKRLYSEDSAKGVPPDAIDELRKMFAFLDDLNSAEELHSLTAWKVHTLVGDRRGMGSLSVTRNRRLTFWVDMEEREIRDLNFEDYH